MKARPYPRWVSRVFIFATTMLAFTGLLQMPLAKRYYLTELPGMAWTGDFFLVHKLHYMLAALLLFITALVVIHWVIDWHDSLRLTTLGRVRAGVLAGVVISGGLRVYRNMPDITLDPMVIVTIEWVHMTLATTLGVLALIALVRKSSAYAVRK